MKKVQELRQPVEIDQVVARTMSAKQMLAMAKRTAKATKTAIARVVQKARTKPAAQHAKKSMLRELEGFDGEVRKIDPPADGPQPGENAPKRTRERARVDWRRYIPGNRQPGDNTSSF